MVPSRRRYIARPPRHPVMRASVRHCWVSLERCTSHEIARENFVCGTAANEHHVDTFSAVLQSGSVPRPELSSRSLGANVRTQAVAGTGRSSRSDVHMVASLRLARASCLVLSIADASKQKPYNCSELPRRQEFRETCVVCSF